MVRAAGIFVLLLFLAVVMSACQPTVEGGMTCTPGPTITGSPSTTATAGEMYSYTPDVALLCDILGFICSGDISLVSGPGSDDGDSYLWVPQPDDVGRTFHVTIQSSNDFCGDHAHQSWDITVVEPPPYVPPPVIDSFTSDSVLLDQSGSVTLFPVFHDGTGTIDGIGAVASGASVATSVLTATTTFTLSVTNGSSTVMSTVTVTVMPRPVIESFTVNKDVVTTGQPVTLHLVVTGTLTALVLEPVGRSVMGMLYADESPTEDTRYTLVATNAAGGTDTASVFVRVVPYPVIDSFVASPDSAPLGSTVSLIPTFRYGTGEIGGIGQVESGVAVMSNPLPGSWFFGLYVTNEAGTQVSASVLVRATGPGTFSKTTGVPVSPFRRDHAAVLLDDGTVFIAGGVTNTGAYVGTTEVFDPETETFSAGPRLLQSRRGPAAVKLADGRVLIVGGEHAYSSSSQYSEIYDPSTGQIVPVASPRDGSPLWPGCMFWPQGVLLGDGRVFIVYSPGPRAEIFDPADDTFAQSGTYNLPYHSQLGAARLADGRVLVAEGDNEYWYSIASELYNAVAGSFTLTGSMSVNRTSPFSVIPLNDGRALVAGGGPSQIIQTYDPSSGSYSVAAYTPYQASYASAAPLSDGKVLVVQNSSYAYVFDPSDDSLLEVGRVLYPGTGFTLTTLADGRVLMLGGHGDNFGGVDTAADIFQP